MAQQTGKSVARGTVPVIAAVCCAATLLLLLAATIVLALIPLYIPQKSVTTVSRKSSQVTTLIPLASASRKRQTGSDISSAVGGNITDDAQLADMKSKLKEAMKGSKDVKDVEDVQADIVSIETSRRRRRLSITRRAAKTYLRLKYVIVFATSVVSIGQQATKGEVIRTNFQSNTAVLSIFVFNNLIVTVNGQKIGFNVKANGLPTVSIIRGNADPAASPGAGLPATIPPTASSSTARSSSTVAVTTTTPAVTPPLGG